MKGKPRRNRDGGEPRGNQGSLPDYVKYVERPWSGAYSTVQLESAVLFPKPFCHLISLYGCSCRRITFRSRKPPHLSFNTTIYSKDFFKSGRRGRKVKYNHEWHPEWFCCDSRREEVIIPSVRASQRVLLIPYAGWGEVNILSESDPFKEFSSDLFG